MPTLKSGSMRERSREAAVSELTVLMPLGREIWRAFRPLGGTAWLLFAPLLRGLLAEEVWGQIAASLGVPDAPARSSKGG